LAETSQPPLALSSRRPIVAATFAGGLISELAFAKPAAAASRPGGHGAVILVDSDDAKIMGHAISYSMNLTRAYAESNEQIRIELVANGSGITPLAFPFLSQQISRRAALFPLLGLAAMLTLTGQAPAQAYDRPPVFRTSRFQFTLIEPSAQFPAVTLTDLKGRPARLASVANKILLVNLWAIWCDACRTDLPLLERFHQATAGQVQVAAVSAEKKDRNDIKTFLDRLAIRSLPNHSGLVCRTAYVRRARRSKATPPWK
jgi:thiol-disulfide isomerase/thioredoxin